MENRYRPKCAVKGCDNRHGEGSFVGSLCGPCYDFITSGVETPTNAWWKDCITSRNFVERIATEMLELSHEKVQLQRDSWVKRAREMLKDRKID